MKITQGKSANVYQLKALKDNYLYVIEHKGNTLIVDPTTPGIYPEWAQKQNWSLHGILNTHHHYDHVGGNQEAQKSGDFPTFGSQYDYENKRIPGQTRGLQDKDTFSLIDLEFQVLDVAAHTLGHIAYWLPQENWVFVGDALFSLGCGRLFEGNAEHLKKAMDKIMALPDDTLIFCAHEYTQSNLAFHQNQFPDDPLLKELTEAIKKRWDEEQTTIPTSVFFEKRFNAFLRWNDPYCQDTIQGTTPVTYLKELRNRKDLF